MSSETTWLMALYTAGCLGFLFVLIVLSGIKGVLEKILEQLEKE